MPGAMVCFRLPLSSEGHSRQIVRRQVFWLVLAPGTFPLGHKAM